MLISSLKRIVPVFAAAAALGLPAGASAGVGDYATTDSWAVPNNTGIAGIPSQVFVPPGRTSVQQVELTQVAPSFPAGGGTDLELRLLSPAGTELTLFATGCAVFPNTTTFSLSNDGDELAGDAQFCATQLNGGSGRPNNLAGDSFSIFNGQPSAGVWTMIVRDAGLNLTQGTWKGWGLRITHAPPQLTATAGKQRLGGAQLLKASCNADCSLQISGDVKSTTQKLTAGSEASLALTLKKKVAKAVRKKGKGSAKLDLVATDDTGAKVERTLKMKLKA